MSLEIWRYLPIILTAPAQIVFVFVYASKRLGAGDWWRDIVGRALFLKSATLALLLGTAVISYANHWIEGRFTTVSWGAESKLDVAVMITYWLVCLAIYYQLAVLIKKRFIPERDEWDE